MVGWFATDGLSDRDGDGDVDGDGLVSSISDVSLDRHRVARILDRISA